MLRFIARRFAKLRYRFNQEVEAENNLLNAGLALKTGEDKRAKASQLKVEADAMDARIKKVAEMEEKGFWLCENGHENDDAERENITTVLSRSDTAVVTTNEARIKATCHTCGKPANFIRRDQMTGQEKYESDKERNEAQKMADDRRAQAKVLEDAAVESDRAAKYFRDLAQSNRNVAGKIKAL